MDNYTKCTGCTYYFGEIDSCMYWEEDVPKTDKRKCKENEEDACLRQNYHKGVVV